MSFDIITVKFHFNETETVVQVYNSEEYISTILKDIAEKFILPTKYLALHSDENQKRLSGNLQLNEICQNDFGIIDLKLELSELAHDINARKIDNDKIKISSDIYYRNFHLPDFISVTVPNDEVLGSIRRLTVQIISDPIEKPFIGGYIDRVKKKEYHHAYTQTGLMSPQEQRSDRMTRDTQTKTSNSTQANKTEEIETQTTDNEIYTTKTNRMLIARPYVSFDVMRKNEIDNALIIQRNWRKYLLKKFIEKSAAKFRKQLEEKEHLQIDSESPQLSKLIQQSGLKRRPEKEIDFIYLKQRIAEWKRERLSEYKKCCFGDIERNQKIQEILNEEIKLLNEIESMRLNYLRNKLNEKRDQFLDKIGAPIKYNGYRNVCYEIDFLRTQKTRKLTELYRKTKYEQMSIDDRIEFLIRLSDVLRKEINCPILDQLIDLLERERKLLIIQYDLNAIQMLRERQNDLFRNYIAGDNVKNNSPKSNDSSCISTKICLKCNKSYRIKYFSFNVRTGENQICKKCDKYIKNNDIYAYRAILRNVRRDERKHCSVSSIAFMIQDNDIKVIIDHIWHRRSILSQDNDLKNLRLPRWNQNDVWSPWNCVCLTEMEAIAHNQVEVLEETYGTELINFVKHCHQLAKTMFSNVK